MDNTKTSEVEHDNNQVVETTTTETRTENNGNEGKDEIQSLKAQVAILTRHLKKQEGQTLDKDAIERLKTVAQKQAVQEFAEENGLNMTQAKHLFEINPNITKSDLEKPAIKAVVDTFKRQARVENNTPGSNAGASENKDFWSMPRGERIKAFEQSFKR
jgi:hypothetical protein